MRLQFIIMEKSATKHFNCLIWWGRGSVGIFESGGGMDADRTFISNIIGV